MNSGNRMRVVYDGNLNGRLLVEKRLGSGPGDYEILAEIDCGVFLYAKGALDDPPGCIVEVAGGFEGFDGMDRGISEITLRLVPTERSEKVREFPKNG